MIDIKEKEYSECIFLIESKNVTDKLIKEVSAKSIKLTYFTHKKVY